MAEAELTYLPNPCIAANFAAGLNCGSLAYFCSPSLDDCSDLYDCVVSYHDPSIVLFDYLWRDTKMHSLMDDTSSANKNASGMRFKSGPWMDDSFCLDRYRVVADENGVVGYDDGR